MLTAALLLARTPTAPGQLQNTPVETRALNGEAQNVESLAPPERTPDLGPRHQWSYEQWVNQLAREATAIAENPPERLAILAGDSISLWFPSELLPSEVSWLNQGISGEVSSGLLQRLKLFDNTTPDVIFVMIGINDLIRGVPPEEILDNYRRIIQDLRLYHPNAILVVQSVLPHSGKLATWEGRDRLEQMPNEQVRQINEQLEAIAIAEGAEFLDLYPLFANADGNLRLDLTTDGLHLNQQGYLVWRSALELYNQLKLKVW